MKQLVLGAMILASVILGAVGAFSIEHYVKRVGYMEACELPLPPKGVQ